MGMVYLHIFTYVDPINISYYINVEQKTYIYIIYIYIYQSHGSVMGIRLLSHFEFRVFVIVLKIELLIGSEEILNIEMCMPGHPKTMSLMNYNGN